MDDLPLGEECFDIACSCSQTKQFSRKVQFKDEE